MAINWTTFATLYSALIAPILAQLQSMLGNVCTTMQPVALAMITAWLGFVAFDIANGTKTVQQALRDFFVAGLVVVALQAGQYTQYVSDLFLQALPNTIGQAMGGTASPVASLDTVLNTAIKAAATTYDQAVGVSPKTWPLGFAVIIFVVVGVTAVSYAFIIYMVATVINVVAVVVGPVFLALAAVPLTRRFAAGWFGVLVSGCVSQLLALAVIRLLSGAEINMLHQIQYCDRNRQCKQHYLALGTDAVRHPAVLLFDDRKGNSHDSSCHRWRCLSRNAERSRCYVWRGNGGSGREC